MGAQPRTKADDDAVVAVFFGARRKPSRRGVEFVVPGRQGAPRPDQDVVFDGDRAVDITVNADVHIFADRPFDADPHDGAVADRNPGFVQAEQGGAALAVVPFVNDIAITCKARKLLVAELNIADVHGAGLPKTLYLLFPAHCGILSGRRKLCLRKDASQCPLLNGSFCRFI